MIAEDKIVNHDLHLIGNNKTLIGNPLSGIAKKMLIFTPPPPNFMKF